MEIGREKAEFPAISAPPLQLSQCPSSITPDIVPKTKTPSVASPTMKTISNLQYCLEEVGKLTKLDPQEDWLPITESRKGNAYYSAFHTLSSGIGAQALVLPLAFITLGLTWGIVCLTLAFTWQLYTLWLLIQLHETESGIRYSRYLRLSMAAFGQKLGKLLALFPLMYLSGGTCVALIMIGGGTMRTFFQLVCHQDTCNVRSPTTTEWYLLFTSLAVVLAQLPNLNSIAGVSMVGAITAISYCTLLWVLSLAKGRPSGVSYAPPHADSHMDGLFRILNALGIIVFAFRGHNLVLEIQGTMPSCAKQPSRRPMWKGVMFAYLIIAMCIYPLATGGYWAYGDLGNEGTLNALHQYHGQDISHFLLGLTSLLIVMNSLSSFQIYAMPLFDNFELRYTSKMDKPCPRWLRSFIRVFVGCLTFFIAVALPFLPSLAGLLGGIALPVTLAYPCIMWVVLKKPKKYNAMWCLNWALGVLGMVLSVLVVTGAIWNIVTKGIQVHFF